MRAPGLGDIVYCAFGGGMGHVTRAAAILRKLRCIGGPDVVVLTDTSYPLPLQRERIPMMRCGGSGRGADRSAAEALEELRPGLLVMDVFPFGLRDELEAAVRSLPCPKALVCRHVREPYAAALPAAAVHFDTVLCAEPPPPSLPVPVADCAPVLLRDDRELLGRSEARRLLSAGHDQPVVVAVSTEGEGYTRDLFSLVARLVQRLCTHARVLWASPNLGEFARTPLCSVGRPLSHYPLLELLNGVDLLVGASGYNLFSEARAVGVPAIFIPLPRRYDDQVWRASTAIVADGPEALANAMAQQLSARPDRPERAEFENRAAAAAGALKELWARGR